MPERQDHDAEPSTIFPIAPVRTGSRVPRAAVAALAVGIVAFLVGIQLGTGGAADRARPGVPLPPSSPAFLAGTAASATPSSVSTTPPSISAPPGSSAFVRDFRPADLIAGLPGGTGCTTSSSQLEVPRTRRDGPRLTFVRSWMTFCPLATERRQSFLLAVIDRLIRQVPSETQGYSTGVEGAGSALFPYAESPFVGEVSVSADSAGAGFEIAITLEERLAQ